MNRKTGASYWKKVLKTKECWLWTGSKSSSGYGIHSINRKRYQAHRLSYEWEHGDIPQTLVIDHICRVRACVNPAHLRAITNIENILCGESPAAVNKRKTHCDRKHPLTIKNVKINSYGHRVCRKCAQLRFEGKLTRSFFSEKLGLTDG